MITTCGSKVQRIGSIKYHADVDGDSSDGGVSISVGQQRLRRGNVRWPSGVTPTTCVLM